MCVVVVEWREGVWRKVGQAYASCRLALGGFAYFMWGINVLGPGDLSTDLTIVQNDKCIDSCGACLCSRIRSTIMHGAKYAYRGELVNAKRNSNGENGCLVAQIVRNRGTGGQKGKFRLSTAL